MTDRMSVQLNGKNSSSCNRRDEHWLSDVITFDRNYLLHKLSHTPRPRSQFFTIRTDPKSANNMFIFFSCSDLEIGFQQYKQILQLHKLFTQLRLARRLLTICKKNLRNERVTQILDKEICVKEQIFFDLLYVSCIHFTS